MGIFDTKTEVVNTQVPEIQPTASQRYSDPAMEMATRNILASYFGTGPDDPGLIGRPIPVPLQQVAGLSPQEIQARNLAQGLGGFGQQLAEAQDFYRQGARAFDTSTSGLFADPRARALYEASTGAYDPSTGRQFIDQEGRQMMRDASSDISAAQAGIPGEIRGAQTGAGEATQRARAETAAAGRDLRSAGQMGRSTAMRGIAGLAGTGAEYDPSAASRYMDPFNRDVIEAQQAEIARLGEQQKRDARSQQIQAGAFGGSRGAVQEAEIGRNVLQQQARTGAELRSQGFQQAQQQAQQAFEQAQGRRQQAAQLTGSLGQAGAQTGISAAGQAGQLGLSAEQLAQRGALEGGQLGLSGMQGIGSLAGQRAGIGQNMANQFTQAQQLGSNIFGDRMGRMQGAAQGMGALTGQQFRQAMDAYGQSGAAARAGGAGIAGLGQQGYNMLTGQINTLGGLGATGRGIQQRGLDSQYTAAKQMADEPYMRLQRGQQLLGGAAPFMPTYQTGYGIGSNALQGVQQPSDFAKAGQIASTAASLFMMSDARLKKNIRKIDDVEPGIGWYTWDWNDKAEEIGVTNLPTEGVIAQEVKEVDPSAVMLDEDGYYRVNYSKIYYKRDAV